MKKVINPSEINELLAEKVKEQMLLNVQDGRKLINERTKDRFYSFIGGVLNNCTGWTKEGGFKKIVKTSLTVGGVALIGLTNTAWIAAGASAYAVWKGHREKKLFKKFVIAQTDEYSKAEKVILKNMSLSDFYNVNMNVKTEVARKFFEVRKSKDFIFEELELMTKMKKDLLNVVKNEVDTNFVKEDVTVPKDITETKVNRDEISPKKPVVMPNFDADSENLMVHINNKPSLNKKKTIR